MSTALTTTGFPTDTEVTTAVRLAKALVDSGFLPKSINTTQKAVALMLTGREMGLGPMAAVRSIAIVDGKPVLAADLQLGLFKRAGGRATFERLDEKGAVLRLVHANGDQHTETFTEADAQRAGLLGKDNWRKHPKAMYRSRAITAGLKSIGFEPLAGVYDPEELGHATAVEEVPGSAEPAPDGQGQEVAPENPASPAHPLDGEPGFPASDLLARGREAVAELGLEEAQTLVKTTALQMKLGKRALDAMTAKTLNGITQPLDTEDCAKVLAALYAHEAGALELVP